VWCKFQILHKHNGFAKTSPRPLKGKSYPGNHAENLQDCPLWADEDYDQRFLTAGRFVYCEFFALISAART
jgi:hypothetical protein